MAHARQLHDWTLAPAEAVALQRQLRSQIRLEPLSRPVQTIAGGDISFNKDTDVVYAGFVVIRLADMATIAEAGVTTRALFPYVPGLLSFRECPALLEAWAQLAVEPDVVMLDGQGIAHPRRLGIASHMGLLLERPTVGCAKSVLTGRFEEPRPERGAWSPMLDRGETIGAVLRTKDRVQPVYVSPGDRLTLDDAIAITLRCHGGYRVPEPTRRAHLLVNRLRREG